MNSAKIVEVEIQGQGVPVILDLLREGICKACEPAHSHADVQVRPLHVASGNLPQLGLAGI